MSASQLSRRRLKVKKSEPMDFEIENAETEAGHATSASDGSDSDDGSE